MTMNYLLYVFIEMMINCKNLLMILCIMATAKQLTVKRK